MKGKNTLKMFQRFIQNRIVNVLEISPFGVLHCVDCSAFVHLFRVAPKSKDIYENCFSSHLFTVAMETLINIGNFHPSLTSGLKFRFIDLR